MIQGYIYIPCVFPIILRELLLIKILNMENSTHNHQNKSNSEPIVLTDDEKKKIEDKKREEEAESKEEKVETNSHK